MLPLGRVGRGGPPDFEPDKLVSLGRDLPNHRAKGRVLGLRLSCHESDQSVAIGVGSKNLHPVTLSRNSDPLEQNQGLGEGGRGEEPERNGVLPDNLHGRGAKDNPTASPLEGGALDDPSLSRVETGICLEVEPLGSVGVFHFPTRGSPELLRAERIRCDPHKMHPTGRSLFAWSPCTRTSVPQSRQ